MDWIGVNIFPWWENKFSGIFPCTTAEEAGDFHIARLHDVMGTYPDREVVLTEFGWPAGPREYSERNVFTGQQCGEASNANQNIVIRDTFAKLDEREWPGVVRFVK
jgi:exo-beta-1,3-glucanase (GH17 family)